MLPPLPASGFAAEALDLARRAGTAENPFSNPVLSLALDVAHRLEDTTLATEDVADLVGALRDAAFRDRAGRLAEYVGGIVVAGNRAALGHIATDALQASPHGHPLSFTEAQAALERVSFAVVFTAHPTFALPQAVYEALAETASGRPRDPGPGSHRPTEPTLEQEFAQAVIAMRNGRDAIDELTAALLRAARESWPDRWTELVPRPLILASWVGYDTDGRTDIGWWDTLRLRLRMKKLQIDRIAAHLVPLPHGAAAAARARRAAETVDAQLAACPNSADPDAVAAFARLLVHGAEAAMVTPAPLVAEIEAAIAAAPEAEQLELSVIRAGLVGHGLALAHTHVRLNSAQLHNAVRQRLGLAEPPADPARRRMLLAAINAALSEVAPVPVDFGALMAEQASAARLMMVVAQIVKHIDGSVPVRFLIAETESGYTLLAALYLARLFGIEKHVEISPLFETVEALESGVRVLEEALRSPHWRAYLAATGRLALQFGYSDSGRYVGQLAASYLIERLRLRVAEALSRHGLAGVEVVFFDTHGESVGRGAHPFSLIDRLRYLSPTRSRRVLVKAGIPVRLESAFQGGDGYLLFGSPELALATVARVAHHALASIEPQADPTVIGPDGTDPIYAEGDFAADFFGIIGAAMRELLEDRGYTALLGAFGPALLDPTGSRPSARQTDGLGGPAVIRHARELRAIPNNAILQQVGWFANTLHGVGHALARYPEMSADLRQTSMRFRRAMDFVAHAQAHSDIDVLRGVVTLIDPGSWLDAAAHEASAGQREAMMAVAAILERMEWSAPAAAMFRRIQADHLALRGAWPDAPRMAPREILLHALRLALIQRIWLLAMRIPDFSPRHGVTREALQARVIRLDIPAVLGLLAQIFPIADDPEAARDYGEPPGPRAASSYTQEHAAIFAPMRDLFALVREIGTAIAHEVGAFG